MQRVYASCLSSHRILSPFFTTDGDRSQWWLGLSLRVTLQVREGRGAERVAGSGGLEMIILIAG